MQCAPTGGAWRRMARLLEHLAQDLLCRESLGDILKTMNAK